MNTTTEISEETHELVQVTDLDQFVTFLNEWHNHQIATIQHLHDAPEGLEVLVEDGTPFKLEGDSRRAFQLGLQLALNYLGELPFTPEYDESVTQH